MDLFQRPVQEFFKKMKISKKEEERRDREVLEYSYFLIISWVIIILFSYIFHSYIIENPEFIIPSVICITVIPLFMVTYYFFIQLHYVEKTKEEELAILQKEIVEELEIAKLVPIILFGLGIVFSNVYNKKIIRVVFPYLVSAVIFGCLMPYVIRHLAIDETNIEYMIVADEMMNITLSQYFGLLFGILVISLLCVKKLSK